MTKKEIIVTGGWSLESLEQMLRYASSITDAGKRIAYISCQFLGVRYRESTLTGDRETEEVFTMNLEGVDCFTLMDYVEAMRLSSSFSAFRANLKLIRYQDGIISFDRRNHFFTDWIFANADTVEDVTGAIAPGKARSVKKQLNVKEDGKPFVEGIKSVQRDISYIPSSAIDDVLVSRLNSGDYIGMYSAMKGLDVSHSGIFIKEGKFSTFRHASSKTEYRKVLDEDFIGYVSSRPGIIVIRPRPADSSSGLTS